MTKSMEKYTVIDLMPVLKKRNCDCFDSCSLMIYGPWTKVGEASMEKGSTSKIRNDGRKKNKLNVGAKKVKFDDGKKGHAEEAMERQEVIRLELATLSKNCKGGCGEAMCGDCYARNKPFESMKAVRKRVREERRSKKRQMRKKKMEGIVKKYFEEFGLDETCG